MIIISPNYKVKSVGNREFQKQRKYSEDLISLNNLDIARVNFLTQPIIFMLSRLSNQSHTAVFLNCHIIKKELQ